MDAQGNAMRGLMRLGHLDVLGVTGPDARTFLQGQLSADVRQLGPANALLASVNSPQGRVQAVLTLLAYEDGCLMVLPAELIELVTARLRKYVLRARVTIGRDGGQACFSAEPAALRQSLAALDLPAGPGRVTVADRVRVARLADGGPLLVLGPSDLQAETDGDDAWRLAAIRAGRPQVYTATWESFVAQMLNLDLLGGVNFDKGCYTGQEIIARAHFRGAVKRRMLRFAVETGAPSCGTKVVSAGEHAGEVVESAAAPQGAELLAVVSLARSDGPLELATGERLTRLPLPYPLEAA